MSIFRGDYQGEPHRPPINQRIVIVVLGTLCLLGGIFGKQFISLLFNINMDIHITYEKYLIKGLLYVASIGVGLIFYIFLYQKISFFKRIRELNLSFNQICLSITLFFTGLLSLMLILY